MLRDWPVRACTSGSRRKRVGALVLRSIGCSVVALLLHVLLVRDAAVRCRGRRGGSRAPPESPSYSAMKARTRSAVLSDSERPPSIWRTRFGSPSALIPNVVGLRPVRRRNALSREANCCSSVRMARTLKTCSQARQHVGNGLHPGNVRGCSGRRGSCWGALPASSGGWRRVARIWARPRSEFERNAAYLHQFIHRGTPRVLAEDDREALAEHLGCSPGLLGHARPPRRAADRKPPPAGPYAAPKGYSAVPEIDVRASAGPGAWHDEPERAKDIWLLSDPLVRHEFRSRPEDLRMITVGGDSMEPLLSSGDRILIDVSRQVPVPPGVFVIWDGMGLVAKRIEHVPHSPPPGGAQVPQTPNTTATSASPRKSASPAEPSGSPDGCKPPPEVGHRSGS